MFNKFKKYIKLNKQERKILNQTFLWVLISLFLVRIVPLRWFTSLLGEFNNDKIKELKPSDDIYIKQITKSIKRIKKRVPWRVKCFEEAIAAKKVLQKRKIESTLYLGVDKTKENKLIAHAWLRNGDNFITGKNGYEQFKVVGFYS